MSLPSEQARALVAAHDFLSRISTREIKRIPTEARQQARRVLKHFPMYWDLPRIVSDELAMDQMKQIHDYYMSKRWEDYGLSGREL